MNTSQFDGLLAFKLVVEKKSFTAAAEALKISPAGVSKLITSLERRMRVSLLTRTTRSVSLTEAGERFLKEAGPAIDQILAAQENAVSTLQKPAGVLRLNMPSIFYPAYFKKYVNTFVERYPDVLVEIYAEDQASDIFENGFDAGIRHSDILAKDMIAIKLFGPIKFVTVASPSYLKKMGRPNHPKDLLNHKCILHRFGHSSGIYDKWEFSEKGKDIEVRIQGTLILNDSILERYAALDGAGILYTVWEAVEEDVKNKKLELILNSYHVESDGFYLYFPRKAQSQPKLRAFIDHIKEMQKQKLKNKYSNKHSSPS